EVCLWVRESEVLAEIEAGRANPFLPGVALPGELNPTGDLQKAAKADALLLAVPAQKLHGFVSALKPYLKAGTPLVICAKGIEKDTGLLVNETVAKAAPDAALAILSGPSFARDVALGLPTAVTVAAGGALAARLQLSLSTPVFRPYASEDVTGVA